VVSLPGDLHLCAACTESEILKFAELEAGRIASLEEIIALDNAVCLCGCQIEDHESYDEGEHCEHDDHECIRTCPAIAQLYAAQRSRIAELKKRLRDAAHILIERVGASGPMNADECAQRAVDRIAELEAELERERRRCKLLEGWALESGRIWRSGTARNRRFSAPGKMDVLGLYPTVDALIDAMLALESEEP
jgi:hypothetical protein